MADERFFPERTAIDDQVQEWYLKPAEIDEETAKLHAQFILNTINAGEQAHAEIVSQMGEERDQFGMSQFLFETRNSGIQNRLKFGLTLTEAVQRVVVEGRNVNWPALEADFGDKLGEQGFGAVQSFHQDLWS